MYAFQITRHGSDTNGNSRWAVTLYAQTDSHERTNARGEDRTAQAFVPRIRVIGGKDMRDEMARTLPVAGFPGGSWVEIPEAHGIPSRAAQRATTDPRTQVIAWHRVSDLLDGPPHVLIATASNRADAIAKVGA